MDVEQLVAGGGDHYEIAFQALSEEANDYLGDGRDADEVRALLGFSMGYLVSELGMDEEAVEDAWSDVCDEAGVSL